MRIRLVALHLDAAGLVANCAQAQAHLLLFDVDLDDLEVVFETRLKLRAAVVAGLGDVAKSLHALRDLDKRAELRRPQHLAVDHVAHAMRGEEALPHVGLQLLDAQAETAILRLNAQNDSLHLLALLHDLRRMLYALGPAQV